MGSNDNSRFWKEEFAHARFFAAPMVDLSHLAFRQLCRRHGAQVCYTPMLHSHLFSTDQFYRQETFTTCDEDRPLVVQFCANDGEEFISAAKLVENQCDAVDLNLGCPQLIAKRGHYGAYLQDEWDLIRSIIQQAKSNLNVPVSCKVRIFKDPLHTVEYARMLENSGCHLLTVHGRTRDQKGHATGLADWNVIRRIRESVSIPVVANGNVLSYDDVVKCLEYTGSHAVMSAEGLLHNPALFSNENPPVWKMAEEYLDLCDQYPVCPRIIRTVLFRLWAHCLPLYKDLQEELGESSNVITFRKLCAEVKERCMRDMTSLAENQREEFPPLWKCHSRPRVVIDSSLCTYRKNLPGKDQKSLATKFEDESSDSAENDSEKEEEMSTYSKNFLRKQRQYVRVTEGKKIRRQLQKERRKNRKRLENGAQTKGVDESECGESRDYLSKRQQKQMVQDRLAVAMSSLDSPRVCIDLGFTDVMNIKELHKLAGQLRRLYGSNRSSENPLRLYFTSFEMDSRLHKACLEKNDGFDKYMVEMSETSHEDLFSREHLIYLTPDSPNVLISLDPSKIYVIGGLVDGSVRKNCSLNRAESTGVTSGRLPINEFLTKDNLHPGTFSQVLAVNQVFDILLNFHSTKNWTQALLAGIPRRKGFVAPQPSLPSSRS